MIAGITNQDSSFFEITSPDISDTILTEDIISFSYIEEMGKYTTGSLQIFDPDNYYSKILRTGARLNLSFGYLAPELSDNAKLLMQKNPSQVFGGNQRRGITCHIANPGGQASSNGVITFSCNFYGKEWLSSDKKYRKHKNLTKGALVSQLLLEIGCKTVEVNFTRQNEILDENTAIHQRETNYRLLLRYAYEWRTIFRISTDGAGNLSAIFISPQNIGSLTSPSLMSGAIGGNSIFLEWQQGVANVIEYSWKNHQGESGTGDNVRIIYGADGRPTFLRYVTQEDSVKAYVFKPERIRKKLQESENFKDRFDKLKEWISTKDFEKIKWAFDPVEIKTAPQGLGYSMNLKIMGNPLISAPLKVIFGEGFPVWFTPQSNTAHFSNYYAKKVVHTIDGSGYKIDMEVIDSFSLFGGSLL